MALTHHPGCDKRVPVKKTLGGDVDGDQVSCRRLPLRSRVLQIVVAMLLCGLGGAGVMAARHLPTFEESLPHSPTLSPGDRIMVLAPHPDDESLGCGGIIQQAVAMNLPVRIVWLTYGDNNEWSFFLYRKRPVLMPEAVRRMGEVRHQEALSAAKILGVDPNELVFLGYPDFGTLAIWYSHWADRPPYESMLTKVTQVPYPDACRPSAPYKGEEILRDLETNLREFKPTKIFLSHPSDHNVDHQALYLFTRVALWDLEKEMHPEVYPYLVHFAHWPVPEALKPALPIMPPPQLDRLINWGIVPLTPLEVQVKAAALSAHRSQVEASRSYLMSFVRANELFGDFPSVDLPEAKTENQFLPGRRQRSPELQEQLTEEEQASFVGIEQVHTWRQDDELVMTVRLSRPLAGAVSASIFAFGYRDDSPFEQMPKLRINVGELHSEVLDQTRKLPEDAVRIQRNDRELTLHIPMRTMCAPQRVLTCVHTYLGEDPLDWAEWRILNITAPPSTNQTATAPGS